MAQNEISDYNETDASNVDITGIDVQENVMRPPAVNNAFRALQGALKRWFKASLFRLRDGTDQTKLLAFDLSGITTATTRTLTVPDSSGTIDLINTAQTISGTKTFSAPPVMSGGGIIFPATQNASSDANTLDDYEEGSWTPAFSSSGSTFSYASQQGKYIKVGKLVFARAYIQLNTSGNTLSTNFVSVTGFPFTSGGGTTQVFGSCVVWGFSTASYVQMGLSMAAGGTSATVIGITGAATSSAVGVTAANGLHATNGSNMSFTICYEAAN